MCEVCCSKNASEGVYVCVVMCVVVCIPIRRKCVCVCVHVAQLVNDPSRHVLAYTHKHTRTYSHSHTHANSENTCRLTYAHAQPFLFRRLYF